MAKSSKSLLFEEPLALKRLGASIFLKLPIYESQVVFKPIYINQQLVKQILKKDFSWSEASKWIKELFSITLNIVHSNGKHCGWAYVDRQGEDAYEISLMGNQGSGRAFYTGRCFNIKGEKTPLATSKSPIHSNGVLSMEDGIWSALIGNVFEEELAEKPSTVLAVLRIDNYRSLLVRIDDSGSLDRITHLFYKPFPLSAKQLQQTAKNLARLEAEKFNLRILHGAWSAGNTSLTGCLIDYDSICAVKGRQPQYSFTGAFPDNYFGFEYLGQLKILKNICDHPILNAEAIKFTQLEKVFLKSFEKNRMEGLIYLMGFELRKKLPVSIQLKLRELANDFYELSHYSYYLSPQNLNSNRPASLFFHLFDFSALFRVYPLLKFANLFTSELGLTLLMKSPGQQEMLGYEDKEDDELLTSPVNAKLANYLIPFHQGCPSDLQASALAFIEDYEEAFKLILKTFPANPNQIQSRAYLINEDRFYLYPVFSLEPFFLKCLEKEISPLMIHRYIDNMIRASRRLPNALGGFACDFRLFEEGFSYVLLNSQKEGSYQVVFSLYQAKLQWEVNEEDIWHIDILSELISASCQIQGEILLISSAPMPNYELALGYYRENTFLIRPYALYRNQLKLKIHDLFFPDQDEGYYL